MCYFWMQTREVDMHNTKENSAGATTPDFTHALGYSYSDDADFM